MHNENLLYFILLISSQYLIQKKKVHSQKAADPLYSVFLFTLSQEEESGLTDSDAFPLL